MSDSICLNALRIEQRTDVPLYVFGIDGRLISQIASVSYARRSQVGALQGYQRPAVRQHIDAIYRYLSSPNALLPNALVLALDDSISFEAVRGMAKSEWGTFGRLTVPLPRTAADEKPAWIVDGQQRATALQRLAPTKQFPVVVVGFSSSRRALQKEQFLLVNRTKPLPRDLVHEILPDIEGTLPGDLRRRQLAAKVLELVRFDPGSPFFGRIRGLGTEELPGANISQAALVAVVRNSISAKGALFNYFDGSKERHNFKAMAETVSLYFEGVRRVWPSEWNGNPKTSRLVHGVGIVAVGYLMDRVTRDVDLASPRAAATIANRLGVLERRCAWAKGKWPVLGCYWNEIQNTSQDKARLTEYLLKTYDQESR